MMKTISIDESLRGRPLAAIVLMTLAGLALRVWAAAGNEFPTVDGTFYLGQAAAMVDRGSLPWSCFPPGWSALVALPYAAMRTHDPASLLRAAQIANVTLGTAMPLLALAAMRPTVGLRLATVGAAVLMFLPLDIIYAKGDLSEMSYTCALLGAWLLWRRHSPRSGIGAGLLFGFAYLIRPEALLAAAGLGCWRWRRDRRFPWRFFGALAVVMLPFLVYIRVQSGSFDLTTKTVAVRLSLDAFPGWHYSALVARNLGAFLPRLPGAVGWPVVLLAVAGIVRRPGPWLWLFAPLIPVPFIINAMDVRFWVPYLTLVLWAAALGWTAVAARPWARGRLRQGLLVAVLLVGVGVAAKDDIYFVRMNTEAFYGLKDAGIWLRGTTDETTIIAAYKPYASYWAGTRFIKFPADLEANQLAIWARNNGASYLIANVKVVHRFRPQLDPLLGSPLPPALARRLTLVKLFSYDPAIHTTAVYRLNNSGRP